MLFLVGAAIAGLLSNLVPNYWLEQWFVLIKPDRSVRPLNPTYIRSAALVFSLGTLLLVALLAACPALYGKTIGALFNGFAAASQSFPRRALHFLKDTPKPILLGLLAVLVIGIALRANLVLTRAVGPDEAINFVYFMSRSVLDILSDYHIPNNHVLHTLLARASYYSLGETLVAMRMPALLAGIASILTAFWLAKRLFDSETALILSGLMAVNPSVLEFAGDARGYTLISLFVLIAFVMATYIRERGSVITWSILIIALSAGMFTIPLTAYGAILVSTWLLLSASRIRLRSLVWELLAAGICVVLLSAVLYTPIFIRSGIATLFVHSQTKALPFDEMLRLTLQLITEINSCWTGSDGVVIGVILLAGFCAALLLPGKDRPTAWKLTLAVIVSIAPVFVIQRLVPNIRFISFLVPVVLCVLAYGFRRVLIIQSKASLANSPLIVTFFTCGVCIAWALSMQNKTQYSCVENGLEDPQFIVSDFVSQLGQDDVFVAHQRSGIASTARYHLMAMGESPRRLYAYTPGRTQDQLRHFRHLFAIVRDCDKGLLELGFEEDEVDAVYTAPRLLARYPKTCVFLVERQKNAPLKPPLNAEDPRGFPVLF